MNEIEKRQLDIEYDERQFNIMIQKIHAFKKGDLYLGHLISDLEALLDVLVLQDEDWKAIFRGYWWDLEQVYAVALDQEKTHLDSDDQKVIVEAVEALEKMIRIKLEAFPNSSIPVCPWLI